MLGKGQGKEGDRAVRTERDKASETKAGEEAEQWEKREEEKRI